MADYLANAVSSGTPALVAELVGEGPAQVGTDAQTVDTSVPMQFKVRGGRKEIILPLDAEANPNAQPRRPLVLALARGYRWQRMIGSGKAPGVEAIAAQHGVDRAYVSRILGLATLAPKLTEGAVRGNEPSRLSLAKLHQALPLRWDGQRDAIGYVTSPRRTCHAPVSV